MDAKQKNEGNKQTRQVARQKTIPVDDDSLQATTPGAGAVDRGNEQSVQGAGGAGAGERGGAGSQQTGWSARQQAGRMQDRAEATRNGEGYNGAEQDQHSGSQESPTGPPGSRQSKTGGSGQ